MILKLLPVQKLFIADIAAEEGRMFIISMCNQMVMSVKKAWEIIRILTKRA